jgi:hypothetical protein
MLTAFFNQVRLLCVSPVDPLLQPLFPYNSDTVFSFAKSPPAQASVLGFITLNHSGGIAARANMPG